MANLTLLFLPFISLIAALVINLMAYYLPTTQNLSRAWQQMWPSHGDPMEPTPPSHPSRFPHTRWLLRILAIWIASFAVLWQATSADTLAQKLTLAGIGLYLLLIALIDLDHHLVLNRVLVVSTPILVGLSLVGLLPSLPMALAGSLLGLVLFGLMAGIGRGAMGMGDVKLAVWIGFVTGYPQVLIALLLGIIAGGVAAGVLLVTRRIQAKQSIAYAPYLALGAWLVLMQQAHTLP